MSQEDVELVRAFFGAYNARDSEAVDRLLHPDAEITTMTARAGLPWRWTQGTTRQYFEQLDDAWTDLGIEIEEYRELRNRVVALGVMRGSGRSSHIEVDSAFAAVFEVSNSQFVLVDSYDSWDEALEAVGLAEEPMSQENVEVVRGLVDAFNRDDIDTVLAAFDQNCEIDEPPQMPDSPATGYLGHKGVREWMGNLRGVGGIGFELRSSAPLGELLLCELAGRGLGRGSDVPIEWTTFALIDTRRGKIVRIRVFLSREEALEAAGLSE
jgi:ketosteroid isomerase-like protein